MNYLVKAYSSSNPSCPALRAIAISPPASHPADNPDPNGNGYGIEAYGCSVDPPYQSGQIMDAIIASGALPTDLTGRDFAPGTGASHIWTYQELLQDMADMHAWGQWDTACPAPYTGICGSWWYGWNHASPGDNSASQWAAIGIASAAKHNRLSRETPERGARRCPSG